MEIIEVYTGVDGDGNDIKITVYYDENGNIQTMTERI